MGGAVELGFGLALPGDSAFAVDDVHGGHGDVRTIHGDAPSGHGFELGIAEQRKGQTGAFAVSSGGCRFVRADGDEGDLLPLEFGVEALQLTQLSLAVGSPVAAIEDQDHRSMSRDCFLQGVDRAVVSR